ncbi:hypothetical protein C6N75_02060 [Streptomyces solincola]|uniref:Uncharacterized protein n=1 Tax=Streptomyces solincola TaxID=2100817 RepID=A0A2S9Q2C7_9ACTN|nr:hypothetical protein C6N75_02060 [Streptomyces solincola]
MRAESGVIGFLPVRALLGAADTAVWPRPARAGLRLVAPEDPVCAALVDLLDEEDHVDAARRQPPDRLVLIHRERLTRSFLEVGRAWLEQVGPCRIDVIDPHLLDDGSQAFLDTLADQGEGRVDVCWGGFADARDAAPVELTPRERRIERLVGFGGRLTDEEVDFLHEQAVAYLGAGDGWTAERILRAVLRRRAAPLLLSELRMVRAMLGRPLDVDLRPPGLRRQPGPGATDGGSRGSGGGSRGGGGGSRGGGGGGGRSGSGGGGGTKPLGLRLGSGWDLLERWSGAAHQIERNAVHKALFAVVDRSVFTAYETLEDAARPREFFVRLREDLVLKLRVRDLDVFEIVYVGSVGEAPGIDLGTGRAV